MGERIRRTDLNQLMREYKGGAFFNYSPLSAQNFQRLQKVYVTNETGADFEIGQKVYITGRRVTFETLLNEYLNDGYFFSGVSYAASNNGAFPAAFCLEPIKQNRIGEVFVNGIFPALMDSDNSSHQYAKIDNSGQLVSTNNADEAEFWKADSSSDAVSGKHFAYLVPKPAKVSETGHLIGYTNGSITGPSQTTTVTIDGTSYTVNCPLLRGGSGEIAETIGEGTKVVISKNLNTGAWQIIEAQCPADDVPGSGSGSQ